jgi:hypothetical protein
VWRSAGIIDDDFGGQGRSDDQRELLDAESVAGHLLKADSVFAFLAAHREVLFPDEMFADLFPSGRGRPSVPADVMASVITLQALQGLSDSETVDAVTFDLRSLKPSRPWSRRPGRWRARPMVERTIAWLTRANRRLRYRGIVNNDHWLHNRAAALNLRRPITLGLRHTGTNWVIA